MGDIASIILGLASLVAALAALVLARLALVRSDKNTSAGTLIAIYEAFRAAWQRFLDAGEEDQAYLFHDLINLFELGSAIHQDQAIHSVSRELLEDYMWDALREIGRSQHFTGQLAGMQTDEQVFNHLRNFLTDSRRARSNEELAAAHALLSVIGEHVTRPVVEELSLNRRLGNWGLPSAVVLVIGGLIAILNPPSGDMKVIAGAFFIGFGWLCCAAQRAKAAGQSRVTLDI